MKRHQLAHSAVSIEPVVERAARPRHSGIKNSKPKKIKQTSKDRIRSETLRERVQRQYATPVQQR